MNVVTSTYQPWAGDRSSALDALLSRRSCAPKSLGDPPPSEAVLHLMIEAAVRAPDHGNLRPWRFICIQNTARVRLGGVFATAYMCRHRSASRELLERERLKPLRAPMVLAVAAAMNLLKDAHILGYGGMWLTGESCHDPNVKRSLSLAPEDVIAGWIYLGTSTETPAPKQRASANDALTHWIEATR